MIGIYKITNPKGKIYIGQSVDILSRKNQYKCLSKYSLGRKIYNSIKKYGWDNHTFEVIENCSVEDLDDKEIFYGLQFESLGKNGLNLKLGNGRGLCSEETKLKMSNTHKNMSNETKLKMSLAKKGKKLSEERKKLLRVPKKDKTNYKHIGKWLDNSKPVLQYTKDGMFIREYDSLISAAIDVTSKKSSQSSISEAIKGDRQKTAYGFVWKHKNQEYEKQKT